MLRSWKGYDFAFRDLPVLRHLKMKNNDIFTVSFTEKFQSIFMAFSKVYRAIYVSKKKIFSEMENENSQELKDRP